MTEASRIKFALYLMVETFAPRKVVNGVIQLESRTFFPVEYAMRALELPDPIPLPEFQTRMRMPE